MGPGLATVVLIGAVARASTLLIPSIVAEVTIALVLGATVAAVAGPARLVPFEPGIKFAAGPLLRTGIVLLGARLSLGEIARIGLPALGTIVVTMTVSLVLVLLLARIVKVENRLAVLLAVGSAVCGNTAIAATAPVIAARPREVAYAVATITLFGTLAVLLYPSIGHLVGLSQSSFGLWAGVAIHDTSQVVAAGAAYGPAALDVAAVVKLIRNALMAPLLMLIAWGWASYGDEVGDAVGGAVARARPPLRRAIPPFVLGFLALAALRSVGLIGPEMVATFDTISKAFVLVALAGIGLSTRFRELRETSWRPLAIGLGVAIIVGLGSLLAIQTLGLGASLG
ncbi:MAG: YeiH family protein [Candidatus Limnocylindrales bacterium]